MRNLNILNGEAFKEYYNKYFNNGEEDVISFNECFADGELHKEIFSNEFFIVRENFITTQYGVLPEVYKEKSIEELKPLLNSKYDKITLWFDFDMFCQINMLTILAYLDFNKYKGSVTVNIIKQDFFYCNSSNEVIEEKIHLTSLHNYYDLYIDMLIKKAFEKLDSDQYTNIFKELSCLNSGIKLYKNYKSSSNEIKDFIIRNRNKNIKELLIELIKNFSNYGLGDTQYLRILEEMQVFKKC